MPSSSFSSLSRTMLRFVLAVSCLSVSQALAEVDFAREVQPLLAKRCIACHGPDNQEGGLRFDEREGALAELDSGLQAIVPGEPHSSELLVRVASQDEFMRMPPEGEPLSKVEVDLLRRWIAEGADWAKHWAFVPPVRSEVPEVKNRAWVRNPIDAFILAGLERAGLEPAPPADRRVLGRRVYFDLIGLPPTLEQLDSFLSNEDPAAYEKLVDQLLASPHFGEKWARHWLDLVRYGESNSFERDAPKPFVWKYRDYVIRSFNEDKPYDQFVREQIAGDELEEVTRDSITATGFYRLGTWDDEPADPLLAKYDDLDNVLSTIGQGFLGLTVGCARCHDHKIDPIPQRDYYSLLAFLADVRPYALKGVRNLAENSLWDLSPADVREKRIAMESQRNRLQHSLTEIEDAALVQMQSADQSRAQMGERREVLREKMADFVSPEEMQEYRRLRREAKELGKQIDELPPQELILSLAGCDPQPEPTHLLERGSPQAPGEEMQPRFPELFGGNVPEIPPAAADAHSAGRRRVLAEWIASGENMLTARVIVNRVWQHHFGRGIVRSSNNFGQLGTPPTHPELLDWLALWLIDHNWQLKPLHRLILTSNTYRLSSQAQQRELAADPTNDLFWRFDMRRLSAEEIRDSVLLVSGQLNDEMYGPSIYPKLSDEVLATQSRPGENWHTSDPRTASRRSIYIHIKRSLIPPELSNFDFPDTDSSCEARFNTTQAAQALNMLHGDFLQTQAGHLAERVRATVGPDLYEQLAYTLRLALQREPDQATIQDGMELVNRYVNEHGLTSEEAFRQYCLLVLNVNEFVYLD